MDLVESLGLFFTYKGRVLDTFPSRLLQKIGSCPLLEHMCEHVQPFFWGGTYLNRSILDRNNLTDDDDDDDDDGEDDDDDDYCY